MSFLNISKANWILIAFKEHSTKVHVPNHCKTKLQIIFSHFSSYYSYETSCRKNCSIINECSYWVPLRNIFTTHKLLLDWHFNGNHLTFRLNQWHDLVNLCAHNIHKFVSSINLQQVSITSDTQPQVGEFIMYWVHCQRESIWFGSSVKLSIRRFTKVDTSWNTCTLCQMT